MRQASAAHEIALLRLVAQGVVGPRRDAPAWVLGRVTALQAQNYWSGLASLAVRGTNGGPPEAVAALDAGTVVRTWPLRGTLHLVAATDLRWLLDLLAARELAGTAGRAARLDLTPAVVDHAERVAVEELSARGPLRRADVIEAWRGAGIDTAGQRASHLFWHLALRATLCLGPVRDGEQLFVLLDGWVPPAAPRDRETALAELARRYFDGHGPATAADLARWANLTARDTRRAIEGARGDLAVLDVDGVEHLLGVTTQDDLADCRRVARGAFVLPGFDELLFGYKDRTPVLPAERAPQVLPGSNGVGRNSVVFDGEVVATWRRRTATGGKGIEIRQLAPFPERIRRVVERRAAELG